MIKEKFTEALVALEAATTSFKWVATVQNQQNTDWKKTCGIESLDAEINERWAYKQGKAALIYAKKIIAYEVIIPVVKGTKKVKVTLTKQVLDPDTGTMQDVPYEEEQEVVEYEDDQGQPNYDEAVKSLQEAMTFFKKTKGRDDELDSCSKLLRDTSGRKLILQAHCSRGEGKYSFAIALLEEAIGD